MKWVTETVYVLHKGSHQIQLQTRTWYNSIFCKGKRWKHRFQPPLLLYQTRQKLGDSCWSLGITLLSGPDFSTRRQSTPQYLEESVLETVHNLFTVGRSHRRRQACFLLCEYEHMPGSSFSVIYSTLASSLGELVSQVSVHNIDLNC